jgi:hypothetical protein
MSRRSKYLPRPGVLILSFILAVVVVGGLVPTPNNLGGGAAIMVLIIFVAVIFKAAIEHFLNRKQNKSDDHPGDKNAP